MTIILYSIMTFLLSAIPFSVLIGQWVFKLDIRQYGDGNPGATNVLRASGSKFWFIIAVFADALKGTIPVGIAYWYLGWQDWRIVPIGVLAIAGHAFTPYLNFNGGKAVAITGGVWSAVTLWEIPIVLGLTLIFWFKSVKESDWAVILMMFSILFYMLLFKREHPHLFGLWAGNLLILLYKHRQGLAKPPTLVPWRKAKTP
jgi:glycerol-3-phosphate acyltransferase PlsY